MTYDASDPAQVAKAEKEAADRQRDLDYVLKEPRGRRFLYELIYGTCHVGRLSHIPGDSDSTAFNEGARSVGEALCEQIRTQAKAKYMMMLEENHFDV
jgi:hypothetical protein